MWSKIVILVFLIVIVSSDEVKRVKRAKYSFPSRFYRKPPSPHVIKGPFSYTPPPNYMHDEESPISSYKKVSKKPINDGLGDEDITNLVKYLSKKDLDKIVEFAGEKERYRDSSSEKEYGFKRPERNTYRSEDFEQFAQNIQYVKNIEYNDQNMNYVKKFLQTPPTYTDDFMNKNPNSNYIQDASQSKVIYTNPPQNYSPKIVYTNPQEQQFLNNILSNQNNPQITYLNPQEQQFLNNIPSNPNNFQQLQNNLQSSNQNIIQYPNLPNTEEPKRQYATYVTPPHYNIENKDIYTDSNTMQEELLPKPVNLREDDYEAANTDNVPKVFQPGMYKVESFMNLPLMNYDSKLHTVSSYHVPHYVVTSTQSQSPKSQVPSQPSPSKPVKLSIERAPPGSTGKDQSDAHLKAIKIWTHRSKGTAYTLHDDGTLSLEKPRSY